MVEKKFTILVVEDDPNDVLLIKRAFKKSGIENPVQVVGDGEKAIAYLTGGESFANRELFPFPGMLITDLKMPRMGGIELLRWLKNNPTCKVLPTIVLTSSMERHDVQQAYFYGADLYLVKPANFEDLQRMMRTVMDYWQFYQMARPEVFSTVPAIGK